MPRLIELSEHEPSLNQRHFFARPDIWGTIEATTKVDQDGVHLDASVQFARPEHRNYSDGGLVVPETETIPPIADDEWARNIIVDAVGRFRRNASAGEF